MEINSLKTPCAAGLHKPALSPAPDPCYNICGECDGTGNIWVDLRGRYLGNHRSDDLDELEHCGNCNGGIVEICDRCQLLEELDHEDD